MNDAILLCDGNITYITHLSGCIEREIRGSGLDVMTFSDVDLMLEAAKKASCKLAVVGEGLLNDEKKESLNDLSDQVIYLVEERGREGIFKYQSATLQKNRILEIMLETGILKGTPGRAFDNNTMVIGIYSPARSRLQSTLGMLTGQMMAREQKVLYINLEPCSGMEYLLQRELSHDLTDIMFYLGGHDDEFVYRLKTMVEKADGLDIVPPVFSYRDIDEMDNGEYERLISKIADQGLYDVMIVDLCECRQMLNILGMCDKILCPYQEDGISLAKIDQYEKMLRLLKLDGIEKKTTKIKLPEFTCFPGDIFSLTGSQIGQFIKDEIMSLTDYE